MWPTSTDAARNEAFGSHLTPQSISRVGQFSVLISKTRPRLTPNEPVCRKQSMTHDRASPRCTFLIPPPLPICQVSIISVIRTIDD